MTKATLNFDPSQPRDPKGSPTGGQWTGGGLPDQDDVTDMHHDLEEHYNDWAMAVLKNRKQSDAVECYIGFEDCGSIPEAWRELNKRLLAGEMDLGPVADGMDLEPLEGMHNGLLAALAKAPPVDPGHRVRTYRGVAGEASHEMFKAIKSNGVGSVFESNAYVSSSLKHEVALGFALPHGPDRPGILLRIKPKTGAYLAAVGQQMAEEDTAEYEFLQKPGTKYRVVGIAENVQLKYKARHLTENVPRHLVDLEEI